MSPAQGLTALLRSEARRRAPAAPGLPSGRRAPRPFAPSRLPAPGPAPTLMTVRPAPRPTPAPQEPRPRPGPGRRRARGSRLRVWGSALFAGSSVPAASLLTCDV